MAVAPALDDAPGAALDRGFERADILVAVALVVVAATLRVTGLGPSSLWLDDAWVAYAHLVDGPGDLTRLGLTSPGFVYLLKGWFTVVGFSNLAAQMLPFVFGILGGAALYLGARRIDLGRVPALVGALILVAAPMHVAYSVNVKQYTLDVLLAIVLIMLGLRGRPATVTVAACLAIVLSAAAGMVAAVAVAVTMWRTRRVLPGVVAGGFALAWWALVLRRNITSGLREYWDYAYLHSPADVPGAASRFVDGMSGWSGRWSAVILILALAAAAAVALRDRPLLVALGLGPLALATVAAAAQLAPLGAGRTDLYLYPGLLLVAVAALDRLPVAVVALAILAVGPVQAAGYPQEDIRPLIAQVASQADGDDTVLINSASVWAVALYGPWPTEPADDQAGGFALRPVFTGPNPVLSVPTDATTVWLLATHLKQDTLPSMHRQLEAQGLRRHQRVTRPGAVLELWRADDPEAP